ncbi:NAD-binding protein [Alishewanella longhuensis]
MYDKVIFLKFLKPYPIIFFGAGKTARAIARSLQADQRLLVVDNKLAVEQLSELTSRHKLMHFMEDCTDLSFIKKLSLSKAKDIYIFTGDDQRDLDVGLMLAEFLVLKNQHTKLPRLIIDIDNTELVQVAQHDARFTTYREKGGELVWFSTQLQVARQLINQHPVLTTSSREREATPVHVVLVGFCLQQQQILRQIVRTSVYLSRKTLHITVLSNNLEQFQQFNLKNPVFHQNSDLDSIKETLDIDIKHFLIDPNSACIDVLANALNEHAIQHIDCVYVHDENDYKCLFHSQRMLQTLAAIDSKTRVVALIKGSHLENQHIATNFVTNAKVYPGLTVCHAKDILVHQNEAYPCEFSDRLGVMIHTAYMALDHYIEPLENRWDSFDLHFMKVRAKAKVNWLKELDTALMWSSRFAADHFLIKVRELGFELKSFELATGNEREIIIAQLSKSLIANLLAMMELEHNRFVAERLIDGWVFGNSKQTALKINNTLIPYLQLSSLEKNKDEAMIRVLPFILAEIDFYIK